MNDDIENHQDMLEQSNSDEVAVLVLDLLIAVRLNANALQSSISGLRTLNLNLLNADRVPAKHVNPYVCKKFKEELLSIKY